MDLTDGTRESGTTTPPRLNNNVAEYDTTITATNPSLLQQPSPLFAEAQSSLMTDDVEEEQEEEEATYRFRKVKMFEMAPSDDPEFEERRQRALYAKRNRDMKRREVVKLQREVTALRAAKEQCQVDLTRMYGMAQSQKHKMEELKQCLLDTHQQLREKEEDIQSSQEKMSRVKAHLEVIAESLEESNISRRMLLNLVAQIS